MLKRLVFSMLTPAYLLIEAHEALIHTTKPCVLWAVDKSGMQDAFDMCAAVAGGWDSFFDECFALEVIDRIGPGGEFIKDIHTLEHFRDELWFPTLMDRKQHSTWKAGGGKDMRELNIFVYAMLYAVAVYRFGIPCGVCSKSQLF